VQVLLHHHVAAARELAVADQRRLGELGTGRVRRAVHESEQVARVEVAEPDRLVDDARRAAEAIQQLALELERHVLALGAQVEEQVARRRRRRVQRSGHRREHPQLVRPRARRQAVPQPRPDAHDAREPPAQVAEADVLDQIADGAEHVPDRGQIIARLEHEEDRRARQRRLHALGFDRDSFPRSVGHAGKSATFPG
jgi:hypothetical protein